MKQNKVHMVETKRIFRIIHHTWVVKTKRKEWFIMLNMRTGNHPRKKIPYQMDGGATCNLIIYRDYSKVKPDGKLVYRTVELGNISTTVPICRLLATAQHK